MPMSLNDIKLNPLVETLKVLDITDEEYFGNGYRDYISNSRLKYINPEQGGSPEQYFEGLKTAYSDSLVFGSAVHELVLQPNEFTLVDSVDRPTAKAGFMADELYSVFLIKGEVSDEDIIAASDKIDYYKGKMDDKKSYPYVISAQNIGLTERNMNLEIIHLRFQSIWIPNQGRNYSFVCSQ